MQKLNLPEYAYNVKKEEGKFWIFDVIRKKFMVLTPEEWVRQHFVHYMISELNYPKALIRIEGGLSYNQLSKRSDIVVYNREGKPWMIVECKAPQQTVNQATVRQASVYNASLRAEFITVTNGMLHYCARINWADSSTEMLSALPLFEP